MLEFHRFQRRANSQRMSPEHRRLTHALLLSLLIHTLLLSLTFGGLGGWLPGLGFPWEDRRIEAPDLRVVIVPPRVKAAEPAATPVAEPLQQARVEQPVASGPALTPSVSRAPTPQRTAAAIMPKADPRTEVNPGTDAATGAALAQMPLRGDLPGDTAPPRAEANPGTVVPTNVGPARMPLRGDLPGETAPPRAESNPGTDTATGAAPAQLALGGDLPGDTAPPPIPAPAVIAVARTDKATWVVPVTPAMPTPIIAAAPSVPIPETTMPSLRDTGNEARARIDQEPSERAVELAKLDTAKQEGQRQAEQLEAARQDAARQEAARAENARLEADRKEAPRQAADVQEAARQAAALKEASLLKAARQEAERQEAARQAADLQEAARQKAARVEAERVKPAPVEPAPVKPAPIDPAPIDPAPAEPAQVEPATAKPAQVEPATAKAAPVETAQVKPAPVEAAPVEPTRVEAAPVKPAPGKPAPVEPAPVKPAPVEPSPVKPALVEPVPVKPLPVEVAQDPNARREAALRAIGRQLDKEAAEREAAARLPPSWSSARRYRLFGRTDPNAELILYAEAWSRKIHQNMTFDMVRELVKQPHSDPVVTVAIRSDGSVESVTFVQSSGVAALDEAIRRVVHSQTPYQVFPPGLARDFDVIEIRRTWYFDVAIRLY